MKNLLLIVIILLNLCVQSQSVDFPCATDELNPNLVNTEQEKQNLAWWKYYRQKHPEDMHLHGQQGVERRGHNCERAKRIIPIWVHVVHQNGVENISQAQVEHAVELMNDHYSNAENALAPAVHTGFQFYLAGIDYISSSLTEHKKITETPHLMALNYKSDDSFVNIYVVKTILSGTGIDSNTAGYASYPWARFAGQYKGIVLRHDWFGHASFGNHMYHQTEGKTLTHEMGHYLGLYHPFRGGCIGLNSSDCFSQGDLCCDVPAVRYPYSNCDLPMSTCVESYNSNPNDQKENFMDYSFESCKNTFTADQTKLMNARMEEYLPSLGAPSYMPPLDPSYCTLAALIEGRNSICLGDSFAFNTYTIPMANYEYRLYWRDSILVDSITLHSTALHYTYTPDSAGLYLLSLIASLNGKTVTDTMRGIEVIDCAASIPSPKGNWCFGKYAGLRFAPGHTFRDLGPYDNNPNIIGKPQIDVVENSFCISDSMGNLVLYGGPNLNGVSSPSGAWDVGLYGTNYREITGSPIISRINEYRGIEGTFAQGSIAAHVPGTDLYQVFYLPGINNTLGRHPYFYRAIMDPSDRIWCCECIIANCRSQSLYRQITHTV